MQIVGVTNLDELIIVLVVLESDGVGIKQLAVQLHVCTKQTLILHHRMGPYSINPTHSIDLNHIQ